MIKYVSLKSKPVDVRTETYLGREWTVVPVVALVEGVIHPMNAPAPELVRFETFSQGPLAWNGRPVFIGHPMQNGRPIPGNSPSVLEASSVGQVFNAAIKKRKLVMEAWLDRSRVDAVPVLQDLLDRIDKGEEIEISVGVFTETDASTGEFNDKAYEGEWLMILPEHLAILPEGHIGACSVEMGCGVRAAQGATNMEPKKEQKTTSLIKRMLSAVFRGSQDPSEMSDNDLRRKLYEALRERDPNAGWPEAVYTDYVVYSLFSNDYSSVRCFRRSFTVDANGAVTVGTDAVEVEPVLSYEPVVEPTVASDASCSCGNRASSSTPLQPKEIEMTKNTDRVKTLIGKSNGVFTDKDQAFLESATEDQLKSFEDRNYSLPAAVVPVAVPAVVEVPRIASVAVEAPKSIEEVIAAAPEGMRAALQAGQKMINERKAASITALRGSGRCDLTDAQLQDKSQEELDQLVKLSGTTIKAAVDYSGQGAPRDDSKPKDIPAPTDLRAALTAAKK